MAEKLTGEGKSKVKKGDAPSIGHNLSSLKTNGGAFIKRLERLHDEKESKNAEFLADIGNVYQDMSDKLGVPRKICRDFFSMNRADQKRAAKRAEMVESEVDTLEMLEAAFGPDSGFGGWAAVQKAAAQSKESGGE